MLLIKFVMLSLDVPIGVMMFLTNKDGIIRCIQFGIFFSHVVLLQNHVVVKKIGILIAFPRLISFVGYWCISRF